MRQVRIHGPEDVRVDEVPAPTPGPRDVVVRVAACGICGTDVTYTKHGGVMGPTRQPMPLGHEISGIVSAIGRDVHGISEGSRVVVHPGGQIGNGANEGGLCDSLLVRDAADGGRIFAIPDDLPLDIAALAEPLGVGMHGVEQADITAGDTVAIFGAGPIGLCALAAALDRGVTNVAVVDLSPARLEIARKLGASVTINATDTDVWKALAEAHGTSPVLGMPMTATDAYIEASGAPKVIGDIINRAKAHARLSVVALHHEATPVSFLVVLFKELTIRGSMEYPQDFGTTIDLLRRRDLSPMISHRFDLAEFPAAMQAMRDRDGAKVLVTADDQ